MNDRGDRDAWMDEKDRREGLKSLFYFGKFILGYDLEIEPHKEVCDFIQDFAVKKQLILLPRGTFKTTIVSQILPIWLAVKNPNIRVLLDSEVLKNSERNLGVIMNQLMFNEKLRHLYGHLAEPRDGNQNELTIRTRTNRSLKEPTFGTCSVDTVDVGPHWDWIIPDDLHSEHNSKTRAQIDNVYTHWRLLFSLLDPGCHMRMLGTRWADLDIYGRIIEEHKNFKVMCRAAINKDGSLFFPKRLTLEALEDIKDEQGSDLFSAQYMNDPLPQGANAAFKRNDFQYGVHKDCPLYLTVDPAIGMTDTADDSAIAVGGLSAKNELFIDNYQHGKWSPYETIDRMFKLLDFYGDRIKAVGIETNAFQKMLKFQFEIEMRKRGKFYKIIELHHQKRKEDRILGLQPRYEAKAVYHKLWMKNGVLEDQMLKFPRGRRDDVLDAVASLLEMVRPHGKGYAKTQRRRIIQEKARDRLKTLAKKMYESQDDRIMYHLELKRQRKGRPRYVHEQLGEL